MTPQYKIFDSELKSDLSDQEIVHYKTNFINYLLINL
jgi:hypothetical protein